MKEVYKHYYDLFSFFLEFSHKKSRANWAYTRAKNLWLDVRSRFMADPREGGRGVPRTMLQMAASPQQFWRVLLCHHSGLLREGIITQSSTNLSNSMHLDVWCCCPDTFHWGWHRLYNWLQACANPIDLFGSIQRRRTHVLLHGRILQFCTKCKVEFILASHSFVHFYNILIKNIFTIPQQIHSLQMEIKSFSCQGQD